MLSDRHRYCIKHIKNRQLLLIVWDVLNNNLTESTITIARKLYYDYRVRNIRDYPDLVDAIAAWNSFYTNTVGEGTIGLPVGINQLELKVLIDDMIGEITEYQVKKNLKAYNDFHRSIFKQ